MKKILFVLPSLAIGGLERMQVTLANALAKRDYDVTVMILQPGEDLRNELNERVSFVYKEPKLHIIMKKMPYIRHKFYDDGMWETRVSAKKLYQYYVGEEKYDVEIGFFRGMAVKIISGSTNPDSVKLAWVHSDFKLCDGITNNFKSIEDVKEAYARFDHIVCVSEQARNSYIEVVGHKEKTVTIYNMLPIDRIVEKSSEESSIQKKRFTIVSVGHAVPVKGYDRLLSVISRLNNENLEFDFWLIGDGTELTLLEQLAKQYELNNVKFLGQQKNPYKFIKQADLYVCSSIYEGYNLAVAEALICGTPVVSTECAGPCEILDYGKYGMIVENNEEGLYQGIRKLLIDSELLGEYRKKAVLRQDFFEEEKIVKQIVDLF